MAKYDILLIGDGTNLLKTIGWVLDYKGFAVKVTASPEAALEAMVKKNYDLVIARLSADDRESLDILKRARRLNPEVKIMVVSGNNDAIFPLEAYELDIDDYLLMPVSPPELWRRVSRCLEDREVMDLQPERRAAASAGTSDAAGTADDAHVPRCQGRHGSHGGVVEAHGPGHVWGTERDSQGQTP